MRQEYFLGGEIHDNIVFGKELNFKESAAFVISSSVICLTFNSS